MKLTLRLATLELLAYLAILYIEQTSCMPIVLPVKDINKRCKYVIMGPLFPLL